MAITLEFGKCAACDENNSKTLQLCRACGAPLPWVKPGKNGAPLLNRAPQGTPLPPPPQTPLANPSQPANGAQKPATPLSKPKIGLGDLAYGPMAVQLFGGLIFLVGGLLWVGNVLGFFRTFPGAGYIGLLIGGAIWGAGQNME